MLIASAIPVKFKTRIFNSNSNHQRESNIQDEPSESIDLDLDDPTAQHYQRSSSSSSSSSSFLSDLWFVHKEHFIDDNDKYTPFPSKVPWVSPNNSQPTPAAWADSRRKPKCVKTHQSPLGKLPRWVLFFLAASCLGCAAIVAGLTLGLMSLDTVGLEIVMNASSSEEDAKAAEDIIPVRKNGNFLLVTLLLTNTFCMEFLPLVLETLYPGGITALVVSVVGIMLFSEIIPQAVFSRHALRIGAFFVPLVRILEVITFPLSYPIAFLLDKALGEEEMKIYSKEELKALLAVHAQENYGELSLDENQILRGTLELSSKSARDIMTHAEDVFMLSVTEPLNRNTLRLILERGHSRVPLFSGERSNIVALLLTKQLILLDPDEDVDILSLIRKKKKAHKVRVAPPLYVNQNVNVGDLLNEFQLGRSHMAIVYDDLAKPQEERTFLGIVTLEDIIEEILQDEIVDETDVYFSNRRKIPVIKRGADGKLTRSIIEPTLVTAKRVTGTSTIQLQEINVKKLKHKMLDNLKFIDFPEGTNLPGTPNVSVRGGANNYGSFANLESSTRIPTVDMAGLVRHQSIRQIGPDDLSLGGGHKRRVSRAKFESMALGTQSATAKDVFLIPPPSRLSHEVTDRDGEAYSNEHVHTQKVKFPEELPLTSGK